MGVNDVAMSPEDYIKDRLDGQIRWYSGRSQCNQRWFKFLRVVEVLFATSIPLLVSEMRGDSDCLRIVVGVMSVSVAVIAGLVTLYKFQENWIEYRTTAETLTHEKYLYLTKAQPYDADNPFQLLVERVEATISRENTNWAELTRGAGKERCHG